MERDKSLEGRKALGWCRWFLGCGRAATAEVEHPVLGPVACCEWCAVFAETGRMPDRAKPVPAGPEVAQ